MEKMKSDSCALKGLFFLFCVYIHRDNLLSFFRYPRWRITHYLTCLLMKVSYATDVVYNFHTNTNKLAS